MTDITINTKTHRNIESYDLGKLDYVLNLANEALAKFETALNTYPPAQLEKYGKPHLVKLRENKRLIEAEITKKTKSIQRVA